MARILIVEDERIVAADIQNRLESLGYEVVETASTGEQAVKAVEGLKPDLVLMDIMLKGDINGIQAAEEINAFFDVPVVYLTAFADEATLQRVKTSQPFGYIVKPLEQRALHTTIEIALYKHKLEQKLKESEKQYRTLHENVPVGVFRTTLEGRLLSVNPSLVKMLGYPSTGELLATPAMQLYADARSREELMASVQNEGIVTEFEVEFIRQTGTTFWGLVNIKAVQGEDGKIEYLDGIVTDITERKFAREALRKRLAHEESLSFCSQLLLESEDFDKSIEGVIRELISLFNASWVHIFEIYEDSTEGTCARLVHEGVAQGVAPHVDDPQLQHLCFRYSSPNLLDKLLIGEGYGGIVNDLPPEDRKIHASMGARSVLHVPIRIGSELWGVLGMADAENERYWESDDIRLVLTVASLIGTVVHRKQAVSELKVSEEKFRSLVENLRQGLIVYDWNTDNIVYANQAVGKILGIPREKYADVPRIGLSEAVDFFASEDDHQKVLESFRHVIELRKKGLRSQSDIEFQIKRPDGKTRWIDVRSYPVTASEGSLSRSYMLIDDVTERKRMEEQLVRSSKLASLGVLAGGIAHQVNNPLATMMFASSALRDLLMSQPELLSDIKDKSEVFLSTLENQIERTRKVVSGLLAFAQTKRSVIAPTDINQVVSKAVEFITEQMPDKDIKLEISLTDNLPLGMADAVSLEEVIINVAQNSYEAMEGKGVIKIGTEQANGEILRIVLADNGPGISAQMREEIFEPLFTTKDSGKGTGLGLSVSVMLLERFGGRISLEDTPGGGATFIIEVPISQEVGDESS